MKRKTTTEKKISIPKERFEGMKEFSVICIFDRGVSAMDCNKMYLKLGQPNFPPMSEIQFETMRGDRKVNSWRFHDVLPEDYEILFETIRSFAKEMKLKFTLIPCKILSRSVLGG